MLESLFMRGGLSLDRMRSFLAVVEAGGMARAAPGSPARQAQFSRQVSELEQFFGAPLLRRRGRGVEPTAAGLELAALVRVHLHALAEFRQRCEARPVTVRLGAGDNLLHWLVIPALGSLARKHRDTRYELRNLTNQGTLAALEDGSIDFGVVSRGTVTPRFDRQPVGEYRHVFVAPKALCGARDFQNLARMLEAMPLAGRPLVADEWHGLRSWAERTGVSLTPALECESYPQVAAAVRSGHYAAFLPGPLVPSLPRAQIRILERLPATVRPRRIELVFLRGNQALRPTLRALSPLLKEILEKQVG